MTLSMYKGKHLQISQEIHTHNISTTSKMWPEFFPFILKAKHKTLHVVYAWAELEILQKKTFYKSFDRSSLIFDRSKLVQIVFYRIFQLSSSPYDVQGFLFCLKYKRKTLTTFQRLLICCMCESLVRSRGVCLYTYLGLSRSRLMSRVW